MNENVLCVEMGIPLLAHPKHTYSKISGLTDSDSEYSYDSEDKLDHLIQFSKEVESNSTKNSKSDQDSLPNLVIYATSQGQTVRLKETRPQTLKAPSSHLADLPFQQGTPIDPSASKEDQELQDLCHEILMVRISELHESEDDSMQHLNLDDYNSDDYNEYLSDNMETTPPVTKVKASIKQDPPTAPPAVTVTVQVEEEPVVDGFYEHRHLLNQKRAFRHQRVVNRLQDQ